MFRRFGMTSRTQRIVLSLIALGIAVLITQLQGGARDVAAPAGHIADQSGPPATQPRQSPPAANMPPTEAQSRADAVAKAVVWLENQEGGPHRGHAIARHVGKTDSELRDRLEREGKSATSAFYDLETAAVAILRTVRHESNVAQLQSWLADDESQRRLALRRAFTKTIGRVVYPDGVGRHGHTAVAVLTKERSNGQTTYRLLTAYVEP